MIADNNEITFTIDKKGIEIEENNDNSIKVRINRRFLFNDPFDKIEELENTIECLEETINDLSEEIEGIYN